MWLYFVTDFIFNLARRELTALSFARDKLSLCIFFLFVLHIYKILEVYLSNRPQVSVGDKLINHAGSWKKTRRTCKRILRVFYQHPKWFISL